jgi:hypothetical protein
VSVSASSPSTGHVSTALLSRLLSDLFVQPCRRPVPATPHLYGPMLTGDHIDLLITARLRWRVRTNVTRAAFPQAERLRLRPRPTVCSSTSPDGASDGYWRCGAR